MPVTTYGRKPPHPVSYGCKISGDCFSCLFVCICGMPPAQTNEQSRPSITMLPLPVKRVEDNSSMLYDGCHVSAHQNQQMLSDTPAWQEQSLHSLSWNPAPPVSAPLSILIVALPNIFRNISQTITCSNQKLIAHCFKNILMSGIS